MQAGFTFLSTQPPKPVLRACEKIAVWLRFWARPEVLDDLLTHSAATLIHEGLVSLHRVALDGMRVRASAAAGSFRRRKSLEECQSQARLECGKTHAPYQGGRTQNSTGFLTARQALRAAVRAMICSVLCCDTPAASWHAKSSYSKFAVVPNTRWQNAPKTTGACATRHRPRICPNLCARP